MLDKAWVHLCRADPGYKSGAWKFVRDVSAALGDIEMIICPCKDCRNVVRQLNSVVVEHLVIRGMDEAYKVHSDWYHHGDVKSVDEFQSKPTQWNEEVFELYKAAEFFDQELAFRGDLADQPVGDLSEIAEGEDQQEDEFLAKIRDAETPLYPSCSNHSKLSAIVTLFRIKTHNGWSDKSFNELLQTLPSMLPDGNVFHTSLYDVKKFLKSFHMGYEKIDACVNDCCLFRKKLKKLDKCPKCNASRWKTNKRTNEVKKGVPQKVLRYFPIIPRLKRMFRSEDMAKDLRWHYTNKSTDGKLRHPVDSGKLRHPVAFGSMHLQYLQDSNPRCRRDATYLWSMHSKNFAAWLKGQISITSDGHEDIVKWLAYGPRCTARSYTGYIVNGQRFHTYSLERQSQNSGVYYEATAMCRSSAKDTSQVVDLVSYYGRITDIILLDYHVFYVPIFRCNWAVKGNGVKVEDGFTLVNLNQSQVSFQKDPYILASQAKQVFYSSEDGSSWSVVMRGASRRYSKEDVQSGNADIIGPLPVDVDMDTEMDEAEYARSDCEGIYVQE